MKTYGGNGGVAPPFSFSALDGEWSASLAGRFIPREKAAGTHCVRGWVGPRAGLAVAEKRKVLRLPSHYGLTSI
jgi:hypothetical protein